MTTISLNLLLDDPKSSNVCSPDVLEKLSRHITKTGLYPPLVVRPKSKTSKQFILIDGHHRKRILESLGHTEADCVVWNVNEKEARLALATLNTLRGTENITKRAELVRDLAQFISVDELATLLPETDVEIADLLAILEHDADELERALQAQTAIEKEMLPVPYSFLIAGGDIAVVEAALTRFQPEKADRGVALVALCSYALKQLELPDASQVEE
jgi:ParB-like chromosome segregation protein Spo0J